MDAPPSDADVHGPPFTQADLIKDVVSYGAAGLSFGLLMGFLLARNAGATAAKAAGAAWEKGWLDLLVNVLFQLPVEAWIAIGILALYGFGSLFFRAGPERGVARTVSFGLMMMAGRVLLLP
ncbi:MAG: hypothetical protein M0D55_11315 [Elusimicrobiota bacterium]|nr:MAG: hypothetical protein M0D55_11315 [Elusimicrobiota bacterium]